MGDFPLSEEYSSLLFPTLPGAFLMEDEVLIPGPCLLFCPLDWYNLESFVEI